MVPVLVVKDGLQSQLPLRDILMLGIDPVVREFKGPVPLSVQANEALETKGFELFDAFALVDCVRAYEKDIFVRVF